MKKLLTAFLLMILLVPAQLFGTPTISESVNSASPASESAKMDIMLNRLNEIKDMDKSNLSTSKRKELRKEVRAIKDSVKNSGGGVYLSLGAIIIILLLLIIIL